MDKEYLTTPETSKIFNFPQQTLYNLINKGTLVKGIHYFKPLPKKILFSREAMQMWIESSGNDQNANSACLGQSLEQIVPQTIKNKISI